MTPEPFVAYAVASPSRVALIVGLALFSLLFYAVIIPALLDGEPLIALGSLAMAVLFTAMVTRGWRLMRAKGPQLTIDCSGLIYRGAIIPWQDIGRVWSGHGKLRYQVFFETTAEARRSLLQVNKDLLAKLELAGCEIESRLFGKDVAVINVAFLGTTTGEVQAELAAHRPPDVWLANPYGTGPNATAEAVTQR